MQNSGDFHEYDISLKLAFFIFSKPNSSEEETKEILIHFNSNKQAFLNVLFAINTHENDEIKLDFSQIYDHSYIVSNQHDNQE
jgi:hypothetical protein